MLNVKVRDNLIKVGQDFSVSFQRTLRIPDDGKTYPLPPGLGKFPVCKVDDYADKVPASWKQHGGVFIPMYQREALWLNFNGADWRPNAVKVAVGKINAVSGKPWDMQLDRQKQDYLVCPDQPWLDGIKSGKGYIRQFIAMPLGMGYTLEGQITGQEEFGGIQLIVFDAKPGKFPDKPPPRKTMYAGDYLDIPAFLRRKPEKSREMGLAAGGKMKQKIYPDKYGVDTWDENHFGRLYIHIVNSLMYQTITGQEAPTTPISAKTYTDHGFPWFDLYDEHKTDVAQSSIFYKILSKIKPVKEIDIEKGLPSQQDDSTVEVEKPQIKKLKLKSDPDSVRDGDW
jgi:hypothetical protein